MDLIFLEASEPLTKRYTATRLGMQKTPYPFIWHFTSHAESATSIAHVAALLTKHAALGHCLLKGQIQRPLVNESRAGSTDPGGQTELFVLDLDGLPEEFSSVSVDTGQETKVKITVDSLLAELGLGDVSYVLQWSASYGIENTKLRAHVFFMLSKPTAAPHLKQWLIQLNHSTPALRAAMELTKTGNSLSWPLDISACQNDKLIYIAPPVLKGIKDPLGGKPRIQLVKRKHDTLQLPALINSAAQNKPLTDARLDELRVAAGLPKRKTTYKLYGSVEVMNKPDACTITEIKSERGFVYFNLNGGDSWAYYHPENNPDYIFNFKGEPAYMTKELLPDYWAELHTNVNARPNSQGLTYLAFCDKTTSAYWRGTYDASTDTLELSTAKNEKQLRDFAKQHGAPLGDFVPEWDLLFDPSDSVRVDPANKTVNLFSPTTYMRNVRKRQVPNPPKTIAKVINNALGGDPEVIEHFMNWLAFIVQEHDRTCTAWVLHGVPGTGKGLLCTNILRPLFGLRQTAARRMEELNEQYNHFMQNALLVFVDEVQTKALQNERGVMAKLKNFITEEYVSMRVMYSNAVEVRNYTNWIFNSNMPDPVSIEKGDRRFNVAKYQPTKLVISDREVEQLAHELQDFYDYLANYKLDRDKARTVLHTTDRDTLISISESSADSISSAIMEGRFGFFLDQLPTSNAYQNNAVELLRVEAYRTVLEDLLARTDRNNGACNISRDELHTLFNYTVGNMPSSPNKFTSLLKHHRLHISKVWLHGKAVNGIKTVWRDLNQWPAYQAVFAPPPTAVASAKAKAKPKLMEVT